MRAAMFAVLALGCASSTTIEAGGDASVQCDRPYFCCTESIAHRYCHRTFEAWWDRNEELGCCLSFTCDYPSSPLITGGDELEAKLQEYAEATTCAELDGAR